MILATIVTVSWTRGYSPCRLPTKWIGPRTPPWQFTKGLVRTADDIYKEDSTRLGDQDKDSYPTVYLARTLVILGH